MDLNLTQNSIISRKISRNPYLQMLKIQQLMIMKCNYIRKETFLLCGLITFLFQPASTGKISLKFNLSSMIERLIVLRFCFSKILKSIQL